MDKVLIAPITKENLKDAQARGAMTYALGAASAYVENGRLMLVMRNGALAGIEISSIPCKVIALASSDALQEIEISPLGDYVWFPQIDEGFSVPALLDQNFGASIRSRLGKMGGPKTSPAKATASRDNGRKGGRPRKNADNPSTTISS